MSKKTTLSLKAMKEKGEKITMITSYDYSSATLVQKAGIDTILVGDSLQMVMLGDDSTIAATTDVMIHHTKAGRAGAPDTFVAVSYTHLYFHRGDEKELYDHRSSDGSDAVRSDRDSIQRSGI